jgi:hypothetical protein
MPESRLDLFRKAIIEIGDAPAEQLAEFVRQKFGVQIEPRMVPIYRATLRDLDHLTHLRQAAQTIVAEACAHPPPD